MVHFYLERQWLLQQTCSPWVTVFLSESVSDPAKAGDPKQTGFCWYASGYCQKMKNLLIKLGMFASDDGLKILVLNLDRKPEIPLPKRLCQWVRWRWDVVSPGGVCSEESPEHMTAQAQGLSGHFGMWSQSALQLMETWIAPHGLAGFKSIFLL